MTGFNYDSTRMILRHAVAVIAIALLAGFALGWAVVPETSPVPVGGSLRGWSAAHVGGVLNGLMAIGFALILDRVTITERLRRLSCWSLIFAIWANTLFYWAGNFAPNRGLSLGDNSQGAGTLLGVIAFLPATLGAIVIFVTLYAIWVGTKSE